MAESTKKRAKSKKKKRASKTLKTAATSVAHESVRLGPKWDDAFGLECKLEEKLLDDAILSAKLAIQELEEETRKAPFERRSGLRLKEKAMKAERAFNRLRALRRGELLPERLHDE